MKEEISQMNNTTETYSKTLPPHSRQDLHKARMREAEATSHTTRHQTPLTTLLCLLDVVVLGQASEEGIKESHTLLH